MPSLSDKILAQLQSGDPKGWSVPPATAPVASQNTPATTPGEGFTGVIDQTLGNINQGLTQIQDIEHPAAAGGKAPLSPSESLSAKILNAQNFESRMQHMAAVPGQLAQVEGMASADPEASAQLGVGPGQATSFVADKLKSAGRVGLNALDVLGSQLGRPSQAILQTAKVYADTGQWDRALKEGLIGSQEFGWHNDRYVSGGDVLASMGVPEGKIYKEGGVLPAWSTRSALGLAVEFLTDPVTYITGGAKYGSQLLEKSGKYINKEGVGFLLELQNSANIAENPIVKQFLASRGRHDLVNAIEKIAPDVKTLMENPLDKSVLNSVKPNIKKVYQQFESEVAKAASEGKLTFPHPTEAGKTVPVLGIFDEAIAKRMRDKLADIIEENPSLRKQFEDVGGVRFAGQTVIPGRQTKEAIKSVLEATGAGIDQLGSALESFSPSRPVGKLMRRIPDTIRGAGETIGKVLSTSFGLPPAFARHLQSEYVGKFKFSENFTKQRIEELFKGVQYADRMAITKAIDSGTVDSLLSKQPELKEVVDGIWQFNKEIATEMSSRGILPEEMLLDDYIFHFYHNPRRAKYWIDTLRGGGPELKAAKTLDPASYQRLFPTLAEAEAHGLQPEYDVAKLMALRAINANRAIALHDFYKSTIEHFGLPVGLDTAEDLAKLEYGSFSELTRMDQKIRSGLVDITDPANTKRIAQQLVIDGRTPLDILERLPEDIKREFFYERFAKAARRSPKEFENVKNRYKAFQQFFPKGEAKDLLGDTFGLAQLEKIDGGYRAVRIGGVGTAVLPNRIIGKLKELQENGIFNEAGGPLKGLLGLYDKLLLNPFRKINTTLWPSFHFRNYYTNMINSGMDVGLAVLNPELRLKVNGMLRGQKGIIWKTALGRTVTGEQMMSDFIRYGGMNTMYKRAMISSPSAAVGFAEDVARDLSFSRQINPFHWVGKKAFGQPGIGAGIENEARLLHFSTLVNDGLSPPHAMERTLKFLFDYDNLTPAERNVFRRVFPFWTWMKKNTALQAQMLYEKPRVMLNYQRLIQSLHQDKNPEKVYLEKELMPQYLKNEHAINFGPGQEAQMSRYLMGLDIPSADLNNFFKGDMAKTVDRWIESTGPVGGIADAAYALIGGKNDLQRGIDQGSPAYAFFEKLPEKLQTALGVHKKFDSQGRAVISADPAKTRILLSLAVLDRPLREVSRFIQPDDSLVAGLTRYFTGAHFIEINPEELKRHRIDEAYRRIDDYLQTQKKQLDIKFLKGNDALEYGSDSDVEPDQQ